jgi:hypothetical protein
MDQETATGLRHKLDQTLEACTQYVVDDIYTKTVRSLVHEWLTTNESLLTLNENIKDGVQERWPYVQERIKMKLADFEQFAKQMFEAQALRSPQINTEKMAERLNRVLWTTFGALTSAVVGMICGGSGVALIHTGPVGWIIGFILAALSLFLSLRYGAKKFKEKLSKKVEEVKIPSVVKRTVLSGKIQSEIERNTPKFQQEVFFTLKEALKPVYETIDGLKGN